MLSTIKDYTNTIESEFNEELLTSENDVSIEDFVVMTMKELEAIENYKILEYYTIEDQDEVDYNYHTININFKKKDLSNINIPKRKYVTRSRYKEMVFKIQITTNLHERVVEKRILIPVEYDGSHLIGDTVDLYGCGNRKRGRLRVGRFGIFHGSCGRRGLRHLIDVLARGQLRTLRRSFGRAVIRLLRVGCCGIR